MDLTSFFLAMTSVVTHGAAFALAFFVGRNRGARQERIEATSFRQLEEPPEEGALAFSPIPPKPLPRIPERKAMELWLIARRRRRTSLPQQIRSEHKDVGEDGLDFIFRAINAQEENVLASFQPFYRDYLQQLDEADAAALRAWEQAQAQERS